MQLTDAEWKVMQVVWKHRQPVTARQVREAVVEEVDWAHTTVKTLMSRLVEKGALEAWQEGKTTHYRALLPRSRARASAARALLEKAFDGAVGPLVHHLVRTQRLSEADRRELERLLREEAEASASPGEAEEGAG